MAGRIRPFTLLLSVALLACISFVSAKDCRMYRGTFELIPTAGVAAPVIAYSPVYKIDHYDYKYNVTADKLAGAATASLYIYVEPHDSTVIIEVGGVFFWKFAAGGPQGRTFTAKWPQRAGANTCLEVKMTISASVCTTKTYTWTCTGVVGAAASSTGQAALPSTSSTGAAASASSTGARSSSSSSSTGASSSSSSTGSRSSSSSSSTGASVTPSASSTGSAARSSSSTGGSSTSTISSSTGTNSGTSPSTSSTAAAAAASSSSTGGAAPSGSTSSTGASAPVSSSSTAAASGSPSSTAATPTVTSSTGSSGQSSASSTGGSTPSVSASSTGSTPSSSASSTAATNPSTPASSTGSSGSATSSTAAATTPAGASSTAAASSAPSSTGSSDSSTDGSSGSASSAANCPISVSLSNVANLSPAWSSDVTSYTCSALVGDTTVVTVIRSSSDVHARRRLMTYRIMEDGNVADLASNDELLITFNDQPYTFTDGVSAPLTFVAGANTLIISSGDSCPAYIITCTASDPSVVDSTGSGSSVDPPVSIGCTLSSLSLGSGLSLSPTFDPSVFSYDCAADSTIFLTSVTATTSSDSTGAVLTLVSNDVTSTLTSGQESASINLNTGVNQFTIGVQGSETCLNTYAIRCTRSGASESGSDGSTGGGGDGGLTPVLYGWQVGSYGACSGECVDSVPVVGNSTRTVECVSESGDVVDDALCTSERPATEVECTPTCTDTGSTASSTGVSLDNGGVSTCVGSDCSNDAANTHASTILIAVMMSIAILAAN